MSSSPSPAEIRPLPDPQSRGPELRLIEGGGEGGADILAPDLYAVSDATDPTTEIGEQEHLIDEDHAPEQRLSKRQAAAKKAGRILRTVSSRDTAESLAKSSDLDYHRRGGGGGWAIREYLKKLAAKDHESECKGCYICTA